LSDSVPEHLTITGNQLLIQQNERGESQARVVGAPARLQVGEGLLEGGEPKVGDIAGDNGTADTVAPVVFQRLLIINVEPTQGLNQGYRQGQIPDFARAEQGHGALNGVNLAEPEQGAVGKLEQACRQPLIFGNDSGNLLHRCPRVVDCFIQALINQGRRTQG